MWFESLSDIPLSDYLINEIEISQTLEAQSNIVSQQSLTIFTHHASPASTNIDGSLNPRISSNTSFDVFSSITGLTSQRIFIESIETLAPYISSLFAKNVILSINVNHHVTIISSLEQSLSLLANLNPLAAISIHAIFETSLDCSLESLASYEQLFSFAEHVSNIAYRIVGYMPSIEAIGFLPRQSLIGYIPSIEESVYYASLSLSGSFPIIDESSFIPSCLIIGIAPASTFSL
jgi:hypothetical protein